MKNYYFETSALRSLGKKILKLDSSNNYFTSVLALLELISASIESEKSFIVNKNCLDNIFKSKVVVDYSYPEKKLAQTFNCLQLQEERLDDLNVVIAEVLHSANLETCKIALSAKGINYGINFIANYDSEFGRQFIEESIKGCQKIREAFKNKQLNCDGTVFLKSETRLPFKEFCKIFATKYSKLNKSITILAFATQFAASIEKRSSEELIRKIYNSYNGMADIFMNSLSYNTMIQTGNMNQPGRNDFLDLFHFAYIKPKDILVTDDKDLISICNDLKICTTQKSNAFHF